MTKLAALLFMIFQAQCGDIGILQMGVTPMALATICGPEAQLGCTKLLYETPWREPVCYMYTTNEIYVIWNPDEAEGYVNDRVEPTT